MCDIETRRPKIYHSVSFWIHKQCRQKLTAPNEKVYASVCIVFFGFSVYRFSFVAVGLCVFCCFFYPFLFSMHTLTFVNLILFFETKKRYEIKNLTKAKEAAPLSSPKCSNECQHIRIYLIWLLPIVFVPNTISSYGFLCVFFPLPFFILFIVRANFMLKFYCDVILHFKRKLIQSFCHLIQTIDKTPLTTQNIKRYPSHLVASLMRFISFYLCVWMYVCVFCVQQWPTKWMFSFTNKKPQLNFLFVFLFKAFFGGLSEFLAQLNYKTVWPSWQHLWH